MRLTQILGLLSFSSAVSCALLTAQAGDYERALAHASDTVAEGMNSYVRISEEVSGWLYNAPPSCTPDLVSSMADALTSLTSSAMVYRNLYNGKSTSATALVHKTVGNAADSLERATISGYFLVADGLKSIHCIEGAKAFYELITELLDGPSFAAARKRAAAALEAISK